MPLAKSRLLFDPSQFFPAAGRGPSAAAAFAAGFATQFGRANRKTRGTRLGQVGGASETFQNQKVNTEKPKPALTRPGQAKADASPTKTKKPLQNFGDDVRKRKPTVSPDVFGGCGLRADGSYG